MADDGVSPSVIRVDGGMVANDWFLQFLADILGIPVERPTNVESTVLGAACMAAYKAGIMQTTEQICAGFCVYGPATMMILTTGNGVNGFTLDI